MKERKNRKSIIITAIIAIAVALGIAKYLPKPIRDLFGIPDRIEKTK